MCEVSPGPRCSFDMGNRLNARVKAYKTAVKREAPESELTLLRNKIRVAQEDYDTTPAGLEELKQQLTHPSATSNNIQQRLTRGKTVRTQQINALEENKNGRALKIAEIYSTLYPEYDTEEMFSLLETIREEQEAEEQRNPPQQFSPNQEDQYKLLLQTLQTLHPESKNTINQLKTLPTPSQTILNTYKTLPESLNKSKTQLNQQIKEIATLQNTTPEIAKKYYQAYRAQYKQFYQNKPSSQQPNPPAHWVKGEFENSGYSQSPTSKYAPHDKGSMYAIYRLRTDDNAIPNYMKQTKQFITIDYKDNNYVLTTYTPQGKQIKEEQIAPTTHPGILQEKLTGKVLLQTSTTPKNLTTTRTINQNDYISKHFDLPSYKTPHIREQISPGARNPIELYLTARKKTKKIWNNKTARANAPTIVLDPFNL